MHNGNAPGFDRPRDIAARAIGSGAFAGLAAIVALALCGRRETQSAVAPINATSHVLWGDEAGAASAVDLAHTVPGLVINTGAAIFWAFVHELALARFAPRGRTAAAASAAAVAALAYVVDYHLVPRRLTPGWELRLSRRSVALGFIALGAGLGVAQLARARRD
jgi:hypothetical protein